MADSAPRKDSPTRDSGEKKQAILDIAEDHLARSGYQGVTLTAIAAEACMRKPSLYYYFPGGKQEVFAAIIMRLLHRARTGLRSAAAVSDSPRENLESAIRWLLEEPSRGRGVELMHDVMRFVDDSYRDGVHKAYLEAHYEPIHDIVVDGAQRDGFRSLHAPATTWSILGLIAGLMEVDRLSSELPLTSLDMDREHETENVVSLVMHGVLL